MNNSKMIFVVAAAFILCSCTGGCSSENTIFNSEKETITVQGTQVTLANWNLQTFFDGKKDGCEYKEYQKTSDWNEGTYKVRLERLCDFINQTDADIYIFEELENEAIIYDISNQLAGAGHNWNQRKFWNYSVFQKEEGSAIGIGLLSRYPLSNIKAHSMDIRIHNKLQPATRAILEVQVKIQEKSLIILANHWKSKSGGEEETEIWRDWQESILAKRIKELKNGDNPAIVICGDFNRDAVDFVCNLSNQKGYQKEYANTFLRYASFGYSDYVDVKNLWFTDYGDYTSPNGSYFYDDEWERIDNIMISGSIKNITFTPHAISPWASPQGHPIPYKLYSGTGYSDHLPLLARIILTDE